MQQNKYVHKRQEFHRQKEADDHEETMETDYQHKRRRFLYPENWIEELQRTTTVDTVIPQRPSSKERLPRPDLKKLQETIHKLQQDIDGCYVSRRELYDKLL